MQKLQNGGLEVVRKNIIFDVKVFLTNGNILKYTVSTPEKIHKHAAEIIKHGHTTGSQKSFEHYSPYQILKVRCIPRNPANYNDTL